MTFIDTVNFNKLFTSQTCLLSGGEPLHRRRGGEEEGGGEEEVGGVARLAEDRRHVHEGFQLQGLQVPDDMLC